MTETFGITPPISIEFPSESELEQSTSLVECLKSFNVFESEDEARRRERVLHDLNLLVKDFVRNTALMRNLSKVDANEAGGKIFTFGSYRLGVHGTGADIDTLCVVPKFVQREDFFTHFLNMLASNPQVTDLSAVPDAYVPVIKMLFDGIPIDLVFARLSLASVPDDLDLLNDFYLRNLDERCVRSLNGSRVTDEILRLVPNVLTFRTALRCIKLWAKKRAIYSNVMGFLGGVAWAMMVARVCQLYPNATASVVVSKFFRLMGRWNWPQPVLLKNIEEGPLQMRVWNPKAYPPDRAHRMPIITPAYPSMCATHNVTQSTLTIIMDELNRAADTTDRIMAGQLPWTDLFKKNDFFQRYKYYIQVIACSDSLDSQRIWAALVESRLRHLVLKLEFVENLTLAHSFIKGFDRSVICPNEQIAVDAGRGIFHEVHEMAEAETATPLAFETAASTNGHDDDAAESAANVNGEEDPPQVKKYPRSVHTTTFYIGLKVEHKPNGADVPRKLDISWPARDFMTMCKSWESYDENSMGICVKYIKSSSLPNDVFEEGEQRRTKRNKSKDKAGADVKPAVEPMTLPAFKKRKSSNGLDEEEAEQEAA